LDRPARNALTLSAEYVHGFDFEPLPLGRGRLGF